MGLTPARAVLISAGRGSRLGALTDNNPKCLVSVAGKAIIDHQIDALLESGVREIAVVAGFRHDAVASHIAQMSVAGRPEIVFNPFWSVSSSIGSVWEARALLRAPFCLINGDTIFDAALFRSALARVRPGVNLLVDGGALEHDDMRVEIDGARIAAVGKAISGGNLHRSLGMIVSTSADGEPYLSALQEVIGEPDGRLSYHHDIIGRLTKTHAVHPVKVDKGHWREIDNADDILAYEKFLASLDSVR